MHESLYVRINERFQLLLKSKYVSSIAKISPQLKNIIYSSRQNKRNKSQIINKKCKSERLYE